MSAKERLYKYAVRQQGMFTTKQAEEAGYKRNNHSYHVSMGNWIREMRGIYRLPMFPQDDEKKSGAHSMTSRKYLEYII